MTTSPELDALTAGLDLHPNAMVVHTTDGALVAANDAGRSVLSGTVRPLDGPLPWEEAPRDRWEGDLHVSLPDGAERWYMASAHRCTVDGDELIVSSMMDVSERHQWAVDAIEGVVRRFQLSWAGSHLPVFLVHVDDEHLGRIMVGNPALDELVAARSPVEGRHLSELFQMPGTAGRAATDALVRRLLDAEDGGPAVTSRILRDDGETRPVLMGLTAARGPLGRAVFLLGYVIDQTPLEELEAARQRDLRQTELVFEHSSDAVGVIDASGVFRFVGSSAATVFGFDPERMVGRDGLGLIHPDDRELAAEALGNTAVQPGAAPPIHLRIRDGQSRWRPVEMVARNLLDVPEVAGIVLTVRDRSDEERNQQELLRREERYRQIVELATDGIASLDADNRILFANRHLERMLGHAPGTLVGRSLRELVAVDFQDAVRQHLEAPHHADDRLRAELVRWDGTRVPVMLNPAVRRDGDELIRSVVWISDLSETEATRARLERSEQRLRALFEAHPDLIFRLDADGTYLEFRSSDESLLVLPPERFIGKTVRRVISEEAAPGVAEDFMRAIGEVLDGTADISTVNYTLELPDGPHQFEARLAAITSDEVISVVRDISDLHRSELQRVEHERELVRRQAALERAALERELERASRTEAMGYLAATMAHDVNNLLGGVNNYASAIRRSSDDAVVRRDAEEISAAVARGAELTQRLLRIGRRPSEPHAVEPVRDLVADLAESLRGAFDQQGGAALVTELPDHPAHVRGSRPRIEQAVMNLVLNARDAAEAAGGRVVVTLSVESREARVWDWRPEGVAPGKYVVVSVVDGGGGIPEQVRDRVFEPFFSTKDGDNSGLGLPIVREVAEHHGGGVGIHAVDLDGVPGTRMELWLPAVDVGDDAPTPSADGASTRVLVVDDDDDVRRSTRHLLQGMGHHVLDVRSAAEAVEAVELGEPIDLVLTDVRMPGTSGAELVRRLRTVTPDLPVLFVTGFAADLDGADDVADVPVLVKPYALEDLADHIDRLVRTS